MTWDMENGIVRFPPSVGSANRTVHVVAYNAKPQRSGDVQQMPVACKRVKTGGVSSVKGTKVFNNVRAEPYIISGEVLSEVPF